MAAPGMGKDKSCAVLINSSCCEKEIQFYPSDFPQGPNYLTAPQAVFAFLFRTSPGKCGNISVCDTELQQESSWDACAEKIQIAKAWELAQSWFRFSVSAKLLSSGLATYEILNLLIVIIHLSKYLSNWQCEMKTEWLTKCCENCIVVSVQLNRKWN